MHDLDLTSLRVFALVHDCGSLSGAAERASMSPSSISKRLAQLEDSIGARLLERRRSGVALTPAGETVLQHAKAMLLTAQRIERDVALHARGLRGRVQVLATNSVIMEALAADLAGFMARPAHRNIQIDVEETLSPVVAQGVLSGAAAIGICWDHANLAGLETRPYRSDHLCLAVPRRHALARRRQVRFAEALEFEQVRLPPDSNLEVLLQREAARAGRVIQHRVTVRSFEAALRFVQAGSAVALVPQEVVAGQRELPGAVLIPLDEPWAQRQFVLCHRSRDTMPQAAALLLEALAQGATG